MLAMLGEKSMKCEYCGKHSGTVMICSYECEQKLCDRYEDLDATRTYTDIEMAKLRNCQCSIPCIVFCNVVIRQMLEEEE